ncbi:type I-C CRISPR-associated protein Cas7/Csd2 [candidate division TA06 bacterium]|uniref:Type I-C CRISPR-associated protein Cas7/Csd2 n=1 Tax=candidate division TA06 bacterium TaxID=2250710 RepID=A0A933MK24_UNCT6|nr:type I-C CRISPR-associated protein Cas7/Csd2 [candidate division TA06 bacterium]
MSEPIKNRYDFVLIFDVKDGNPNGDPDAGNLPRVDAETGQGIVTDVCLKRKVRNFVQMTKPQDKGYDIFVKEKAVLNDLIDGGYAALGIDLVKPPADKKDGKDRKEKGTGQGSEVSQARMQMCKDYYDIRTFGAVMSTGANAGQVRGPVQFTFGRSVDQIVSLEHCITRMAVTTKEDAEKQSGDNRTMGRKNTVPYGVYVAHGFISAHLAAQTGFTDDDLNLLWDALVNMFEHDRSAARGLMATQKLVVFKHDNTLGKAPAHKLFERVVITRKDKTKPPRDISDYAITVNKDGLPQGVEIIEKL